MRTRAAPFVVALAAATSGCTGGTDGDAAASCVGPQVSVSAVTSSPGDTVTVSGERLGSGCADGNGEEEPATDVAVLFLQADRSTELARVDATGDRATATVDVTVPADALPGAAAIAMAVTDGPCPPAAALTIDGGGPTAAPLAGARSWCGRWPGGATDQAAS